MEKSVLDIVMKSDKFPRMLSKSDGNSLKKYFEMTRVSKVSLKAPAIWSSGIITAETGICMCSLEEYLFRENEPVFEISRAVGVNYYLNKLP